MKKLLLSCLLLLIPFSTYANNALSSFSALRNAGLLVVDQQGRSLRADRANQAFIPASTTKLVTAWLALEKWGENHRFHTNFYYEPQSKILWVKGSGDPYLVSEELATIAQQLKRKGLTQVNAISLDSSYFVAGLVMPGTGRTNNPYDAVPSAIAANFNTVNIKKRNGKVVSAEPQTPLTPYAASMGKRFKSGTLRVNTGRNPRDAETYFAQLFAALLRQQGINVESRVIYGKRVLSLQPYYQHYNSRTLGEVIRPMMKYSTNFIANQLVLALSAEHYRRPANAEDVKNYMQQRLSAVFQWKNFAMRDGAGLSRANRLSPQQLVQLLKSFQRWKHLLPEVEPGVYAKSGTLNGVSTLAGYLVKNNQWKPFALMMNQSVPHKLRNRIARELRKSY